MPVSRRDPARPAAATRPSIALVAVTFALLGIAKTTGSGWLIVILSLVASVAVLSVALPAAGLLGIDVALDMPRDATVGRPFHVSMSTSGRHVPVTLRLAGSFRSNTIAFAPPACGRFDAVPERRGVFDEVTVELRCGAPLGLFWWRRRLTIALASAVEVGPAPIASPAPAPDGAGADGDQSGMAGHAGSDIVRGVRAYRPGDPIKTIHWTASARHGDLLVKELEAVASPPLVIEVELPPGEAAETVAGRAAGIAAAAFEAGVQVTLLTAERAGPVAAPARSSLEVGRRLARAVPGAPATAPRGGRLVRVDADGVRW